MNKVYKTFYDISRFVIFADSPSEDGGKRPRFVLSFRDGNPRFVVYTGDPGKEGAINFPTENITLTVLMHQLLDLANGPNEQQISNDSLTAVYENDKPTNQKKVVSTLHMGKSKDGIVYLCLSAEGKPKVVFPFKASPFHVFRGANKQEMPADQVSKALAKAFASIVLNLVTDMIDRYTAEEYEEGPRKPTVITGNTGAGGGKPAAGRPAQVQFADLDDIL